MVRLFGLFLSLSGIITMGYFFFPIISWQLYLAPVFAAENIATPIPKATVLNQGTFASLARQTTSLLLGVNYSQKMQNHKSLLIALVSLNLK
jgi:hypothetical protein